MLIDHEDGYDKKSIAAPVIPLGAPGEWDDYFVYGAACINVGGTYYLYYGGGRNQGANPRLEKSVGLATSADGGVSWVKQGKLIDRDDVPDLGLAPFSILEIDGVYHLFCSIFNNTGTTYKCCVLTSQDLVTWGSFAYLSGLDASAHAPYVINDPHDSSKIILFYSSMVSTLHNKRAVADKTDPTSWSGNAPVTSFFSIYPAVRWEGDRFKAFFAKPATHGYRLYASASIDGLSFPDTNLIAVQPGASGSWDESYITASNICDDMLFYSARKAGAAGYEGIGMARIEPVGSVLGWDWVVAGVGPSTVAHSGDFGVRLVAGTKGRPSTYAYGKGRDKKYEVWIYDDLVTHADFQNTFRLLDAGSLGPVLGIWCGSSTANYIYRVKGGGWSNTGIARSAGWHCLTFEVADDVAMKIDGVTVATDTVFDTDAQFTASLQGYDYGTGYADDYSVTTI